ncbi:MAG TPA: FtsX-like permease family protein [Acidimicrobiia bacterium]
MAAIHLLLRTELRRRWRGVVLLTLLVGVVGAVVLASAAGARRSSQALDRFEVWSHSSDIEFLIGGALTPDQVAAIRNAPGVRAMARLTAPAIFIDKAPHLTAIAAPVDAQFGGTVDRARIVSGRAADQNNPFEVTVGENLAAQLHLRVGDHLDGQSYSVAQGALSVVDQDPGPPAGPHIDLRIVGIDRRPLDLGDRGATGGVLILTRAFGREVAGKTVGTFGTVFRIRTRRGTQDVSRVVREVRTVAHDAAYIQVNPLNIESEGGRGAINVLTVALWIFAAVAALAGVVAIAIVLTRQIWLLGVDQPALRALGVTRAQRIALVGFPALVVAGGGAAIAALGALAASPLFPVGLARRADPDLGFHADSLVLGFGAIGIIAITVAIGVVASVRRTASAAIDADAAARPRPSAVVALAARVGCAPAATNGLSMALEPGRGRTAVPVRSAYLGAVFGIVGITAVVTFAVNLDHLVATPRQYGWTFDYAVSDEATSSCNRAGYGVADLRGVAAVASLCTGTVQVDRDTIAGWSFTPLRGTLGPEVLSGRAPSGAHDVALGAVTLEDLGKSIGDTVTVGSGKTTDYRIVGSVVLPTLGMSQPLADGAVFTHAGLEPYLDLNNGSRYLAFEFAPNAHRGAIERRIARTSQLDSPVTPTVPPEVDRLRQIRWFPATLAALLATLALLAVGHALVTAVRRRRRDLALLKTLGFDRRGVRATVAWQATTLGIGGLVVGLPVGLLVGSVVWRLVADSVGVSDAVAIPALALLLTIACALALVNLIAYFPGRSAARIRPAVALRTE